MHEEVSTRINWYDGIHEIVGCRHWSFFHAEVVGDRCRRVFECGEILEISEGDYRWGHRGESRAMVRGQAATLKAAVEAIEDRLTSLNGHERMKLYEAREAAGLPLPE
jgi:hypothetical protein